MAMKIGILANLEKSGASRISDQIRSWAAKAGHTITSNLDKQPTSRAGGNPFGFETWETFCSHYADVDLVVTMGGDGTLLYAAPMAAARNVPILSVNLGSLGFHTQASPDNIEPCLAQIEASQYVVHNRMLFQARKTSATGSDTTPHLLGLNDIVISKSAWGHMVTLNVTDGDEVITDVSADALIVATPTGSSAYNYAAGGPVLSPDMEAFVLNALCAHRMRVTPLVLPPTSELSVTLKPRRPEDSAQILIDGQPWEMLTDSEVLKISRAPVYLPLIIFENDFYGKLRDKLRWGGLF